MHDIFLLYIWLFLLLTPLALSSHDLRPLPAVCSVPQRVTSPGGEAGVRVGREAVPSGWCGKAVAASRRELVSKAEARALFSSLLTMFPFRCCGKLGCITQRYHTVV